MRLLRRGLLVTGALGIGLVVATATADEASAGPLDDLLEPLTQTVDEVLAPVADDIVAPVVETVVAPVVDEVVVPTVTEVVEPVAPVVADVVEPVVDAVVAPVVDDVVAPVVDGVLSPVVDALQPVVTPVAGVLVPVTDLVEDVTEPLAPVVEPLQPVIPGVDVPEVPVVTAPQAPAPGAQTQPSGSDQAGVGTDPLGEDAAVERPAVSTHPPRPWPDVTPAIGVASAVPAPPSEPVGHARSAAETGSQHTPAGQPENPSSVPTGTAPGSSSVRTGGNSGHDAAALVDAAAAPGLVAWAGTDREARTSHPSTFFNIPVSPG